jgi:hypothetical protein
LLTELFLLSITLKSADREFQSMFKFEHSYLIFKLVQLFDPCYFSERTVTIDLVARLTEIMSLGERSELMARLQRDLPTYIAAANGFSMDNVDVGDFTKEILSWQKKHVSEVGAYSEAARIAFAMAPNSAGVERAFSLLKILLFHCWWCWRAIPAAINTFVKSLHCADHRPFGIGDERERLVAASPVMTKSRARAAGNNYPESSLVKPPRRNTRARSPAGIFGGKAVLCLAAQKSRLHAPSVPMRSAPAYFLCDWGV